MKSAKSIIQQIEKRVWTLTDDEKTKITEFVKDNDEGDLTNFEFLAYEIADLLRTNESVIYDILTD